MIQNGHIEQGNNKQLAEFFWRTEGIDKTILGDYLGSEEHQDVLSEFVKLYDFKKLRIVESLRIFL